MHLSLKMNGFSQEYLETLKKLCITYQGRIRICQQMTVLVIIRGVAHLSNHAVLSLAQSHITEMSDSAEYFKHIFTVLDGLKSLPLSFTFFAVAN
jgi:hypothetical protein